MRFPRQRLVSRKRDGRYTVRLPDEVRQLLGQLLTELRDLLTSSEMPAGDGRLERLFPPAYLQDPDANAEYQHYMRDELMQSKLSALDTVRDTLEAKDLSEGELMAWMQSVNSIRLVLGTMLDVSEDDDMSDLTPDDPGFGAYLLYGELSVILEHIVAAMGD